jgi:hypothetical protein
MTDMDCLDLLIGQIDSKIRLKELVTESCNREIHELDNITLDVVKSFGSDRWDDRFYCIEDSCLKLDVDIIDLELDNWGYFKLPVTINKGQVISEEQTLDWNDWTLQSINSGTCDQEVSEYLALLI